MSQIEELNNDVPIEAEAFYRYGYKGREMIAIRSPFAMSAYSEIIGRDIRVGGVVHRILGVWRQISGPVQKGEPIGVEIESQSSIDESAP